MLEPIRPSGSRSRCRRRTPLRSGRVRAATDLPIATGERLHTIEDVLASSSKLGVADIVQVDLTHFGGFLPMKNLAGWPTRTT